MAFIDQLRRKIEVDRLCRNVLQSLRPPGSERHVDRDSARALLAYAGFSSLHARDLEIYQPTPPDGPPGIIVLDNDLPLYRAKAEDIALRRSPTVKEMLNIGNIRRILNDKDIRVSQQADTVRLLRQRSLEGLDLTFTPADLEQLALNGRAALDGKDHEGILDSLVLFAELLDWRRAPQPFRLAGTEMFGALVPGAAGEHRLGPVAAFSELTRRLVLVSGPVSSLDREGVEELQRLAVDTQAPGAAAEGPAVFDALVRAVMHRFPQGVYVPSPL
jgi:hypothetical protein